MNLITAVLRRIDRIWTQLRTGSGTEGEDCGAVGVLNVVTWASRGKVGPRRDARGRPLPARDPQSVASWVRQVREWAGRPEGAMLVHGDVYEVLRHPRMVAAFRAANVRPPTVRYLFGEPFGSVRAFLARSDDHAVLLPFDYGIARADGAPVGSTTFSDAHYAMLSGAQRRRVRVGRRLAMRWKTVVVDSLMDGRRVPGSLRRYRKGAVLTQLYRYRRAAGEFGTGPDGKPRPIGFGRTVVIEVERS